MVAFLWDFRKFFDSIDRALLVQKFSESVYPTLDLLQALVVHAAPRVLQFAGATSESIFPGRPILAGCEQSIPLTTAYLAT